MNFKGLVFDLDGVITETATLHYKAWADEVKKIGINFTEEENATLKGLPRLETLLGILKIHNREGEFTQEELTKMATDKNDKYKEMLKTGLTKADILPGIEKLLNDAKEMGLKMSVASSSYNAPVILEKIGLSHYFDFIVNPGDLTKGKPDPEIFVKGCEGIGISTSEAIGFEDAMPGVEGLVAAGIKTVAITHGDEGNWQIADIVLKSTSEIDLKEIINTLK